MSVCCVSDCSNRHSSRSKVKFHRVPTGKSPFNTNRRKLWWRAIQQANNCTTGLDRNARICGAHFISGEVSLDHDNVDFIPSVFKCIKRSPKKKVTRFMSSFFGSRRRRCRKKEAGQEEMKTPPKADPWDDQSSDLMETDSELSEELEAPPQADPVDDQSSVLMGNESEVEAPSTPSVAKEAETLTTLAEAEKGASTIPSETTSSPNKTSPSAPAVSPNIDKRNPVVLLQPLILQAGGYRFHLCSRNLTTAAQPVKDEQPDEEEKPCSCGICGKQFPNQTGFTQHQCVKPEEPSFPCNICDRSFTSYHCLKRHKLLHVKDGRKCGKCGVLFCRRHNHTPFKPATKFKEESSSDELQTEDSDVKPGKGLKSDKSWTPGAMTVKPTRKYAKIVPKPPPTINTVPTPPSTISTVPTPSHTTTTVPTPPSTTTTTVLTSPNTTFVLTPPIATLPVPTPSHTTITVPAPPSTTTTTVLASPNTTFVLTPPIATPPVPTPSHTATAVLTAPITAIELTAPITTAVPTPSHSTTTVRTAPITTTTTPTTTVRTPPNPQPLSKTHKFKPPGPDKRVRAKRKPAPSSTPCPPPPEPGCSGNPDTSAEAVQPPRLPSSLKIFSPQYLTSALLQVTRNYEYIPSKSKEEVKYLKKEPCERPISPVQQIVRKRRIAYDLEIVV